MERIELTIDASNAGRRADTVLLEWLAPVSHGELCRWLRRGFVRGNGRRLAPRDRLAEGDCLQAPAWAFAAAHDNEGAVPPPAPALRTPLPKPWVVYEDGDLIVVNKPAHLASHGGIGHDDDNLAQRLLAHCGDGGVGRRPGLAQRLDAGVSGLVPCGKHAAALKVLMGPPHGPALHKVYVALVHGEVLGDSGHIDQPLRSTDQPRGDAPKVVVDFIAGKPSYTAYVTLGRLRGRSLLALTLRTGRTHQIRAHLRALGHPLVGDARYGIYEVNEAARASWGCTRPLLHAGALSMAHPVSGAALTFSAPAPADFRCAAGPLGVDELVQQAISHCGYDMAPSSLSGEPEATASIAAAGLKRA